MKDEMIEVLRMCVRKLTEMQLHMEGPRAIPLIEVTRAEAVLADCQNHGDGT